MLNSRSISKKWFVLGILGLLINCAGAGPSDSGISSQASTQEKSQPFIDETGAKGKNNPAEIPEPTNIQSPSSLPLPKPDPGADYYIPYGSIPKGPSAVKKEKILAYAPDADEENSNIPFIGSEGAAKPEPGNQILVSTIDMESNSPPNNSLSLIESESNSPPRGRGLRGGAQYLSSLLIASASAKPLHPCKQPGNYCFPIDEDGSFEAYLPVLESHENIYAAVVDEKGNISEPITEKVNQNILWMREKPKDLISAIYSPLIPSSQIPSPLEGEGQGAGVLYALTKNIGVQITSSDDGLHVLGSHENNYESFVSPKAEQLAYEPISKILATKRPALDILLNPNGFIPPGAAVAPMQKSITVPEAKSYTVLKTASNGKMYFGIETRPDDKHAIRRGRIRYATNPDSPETIVFLENNLFDESQPQSAKITHSKTLAFDVDVDSWALVAFEDTQGQTRLRMGFGNNSEAGIRVGGELPFGEALQLNDLQVYHANKNALNHGKALMPDIINNRVAMINFNHFVAPIPNGPQREIVIEQWINLGPNKSPQSLALNPGKTKAYIANKADDTLSILTLKENNVLKTPSEIQKNIQTIKLGDLLKDKKLYIQPNKVLYQQSPAGDYLLVGSEDLRGAIIIPIENLESLGAKD